MDALLMCGGRGTRLAADVEKPLFAVGGRPMVDRVQAALAGSGIDTVHAVTSPHAPRTAEYLDCPTLEAPGDGYVADLQYALDRVEGPVLTVAADLPLLAPGAVDAVLAAHDSGSLTVCVPAPLKRLLGVGVDATRDVDGRTLAPTGVNVVGDGGDDVYTTYDARLAVNVNRRADAAVAERLVDAGDTE